MWKRPGGHTALAGPPRSLSRRGTSGLEMLSMPSACAGPAIHIALVSHREDAATLHHCDEELLPVDDSPSRHRPPPRHRGHQPPRRSLHSTARPRDGRVFAIDSPEGTSQEDLQVVPVKSRRLTHSDTPRRESRTHTENDYDQDEHDARAESPKACRQHEQRARARGSHRRHRPVPCRWRSEQ